MGVTEKQLKRYSARARRRRRLRRLTLLMLVLAAAYQLPDCLQVLSVGVLRGFRDTASITFITFFSYWMVGFPACYILARTDWIVPAMGARGIWTGFIIGLSVAAVLLLWRVVRTVKREFKMMRLHEQ